jgi:hypothetical protein
MNHYLKMASSSGWPRSMAGCGGASSTHKADPYCPAVIHVLPKSAPMDANTTVSDMQRLLPVIPSGGKDKPLDTRILAVDRALESIGKTEANILGQPSADQLARYYKAVSQLRAYCRP